jgi:GWxTD domain-containing protein
MLYNLTKFKNFFFLILCLCVANDASAQTNKLRVYLDTKQFYNSETGNYIEVYFQFVGYTVNFISGSEGLQADVAISLQFKENDSTIINDVYRLQSPIMKDSIIDDFFDVQRFALAPGSYTMIVQLADINSNQPAIQSIVPITIEDLSKGISVSDIESLEYAQLSHEDNIFVKSGYHMIPRLSTFYAEQLTSLPVYLEFYNTSELIDSICAVKEFIVDTESGEELLNFTNYVKQETAAVIPLLRNIDISDLPSGKYALNYALLSSNLSEMATQSFFFERSNEVELNFDLVDMVLDPSFQASISEDSVSYYLESLIPISKPAEVKNIISVLKNSNEEGMRRHIQAFWAITTPESSYDSWIRYKAQVNLVQELYGNNFQEGFETDRGRVYLQYGAPTNINQREISSSEYPYEIWMYNKIGQFSNRRFIFYNPDLVNNAYRLLHSDMLGELKNPSWPQILSSRNTNKGNVDNPNQNVQDHWGGNSDDLFRQY